MKLYSIAILVITAVTVVFGCFYGLLWMQGKDDGNPIMGIILFALAPLCARGGRLLIQFSTPGWPKWMFK